MTDQHIPVMMDEAIAFLKVRDGGTYVDGTFGRGGYSKAILDAANANVIAIDRDPEALKTAEKFTAIYGSRFTIIPGKFGNLKDMLRGRGITAVDGVVLDLGISSPQIDDAARGFSFQKDGPLDMRMNPMEGMSARDVVNTLAADRLQEIIADLGEERRARKVAEAIVAARREAPIETTLQLANLIRRVVPKSKDGIDPATRTFQGLRLFVNDELGELERALSAAEELLVPGGRLVCVSFHSLEDRIVKNFLRTSSGSAASPSRHMPVAAANAAPTFTLLSRSALPPSPQESRANPRSRSARLRAAERTVAPFQDHPTTTDVSSSLRRDKRKSPKSRRG
ncbi:MAG: 16S rRNA (cytosine(1402)-N(4))-methyltransferase RsmH [Bdellovibrionales bacterium]